MSLRLRILIAIGLVLALGSGFGLALAGWHARQWLREELVSAQDSGRLEVTRAFAGLTSAQPRGDLSVKVDQAGKGVRAVICRHARSIRHHNRYGCPHLVPFAT